MEDASAVERRQIEIELLQAMYPGQVEFDSRTGELKYAGNAGSMMLLRIPQQYPLRGFPDLIGATDPSKNDLRPRVRTALDDMKLLPGEEILDAIIQCFEEVLTVHTESELHKSEEASRADRDRQQGRFKTVIIWLHHLLNTNKRKLALNPTISAAPGRATLSGLTKPGYPGILVYCGPSDLVDAHVTELRSQRWQAFQVRYEQEHDEGQIWRFRHGSGIVEVESMSDITHGIADNSSREDFLKATGVK